MDSSIQKQLLDRLKKAEDEIADIKKKLKENIGTSAHKEVTNNFDTPSKILVTPLIEETAKPNVSDTPSTKSIPTSNSEYAKPNKRKRSNVEVELLLGGNLIGKLGLFAIILASFWFIQFAFNHPLMNESGRIYIGMVAGLAILYVGYILFRKKFSILAPVIMGTGLAILFMSIYLAFYFYNLLNFYETFIYLVIITAFSSYLSYKIRNQYLYLFSLVGAYLVPILLSRGENSYYFLFSYLLAIHISFIFISRKYDWLFANYTIILTECIIFGNWSMQNLSISSFYYPCFFVLTVLLLNFYKELKLSAELRKKVEKQSLILLAIHSLIIYSYVFLLTHEFYSQFTAHSALAFAFILLVIQKYIIKQPPQLEQTNSLNNAQNILFFLTFFVVFIAITEYAEGNWRTVAWLAFSGSLTYLSIITNSGKLVLFSLPFWLLTFGKLYLANYEAVLYMAIINVRFLIFVATSGVMVYLYKLYKKASISEKYFYLMNIFLFAAILTIIVASLLEVHDFIHDPHYRNLAYSYVLFGYAFVCISYGIIQSDSSLRWIGLFLLGLVLLKLYLYDIWALSKIVRIISGFSLGVVLVLVSLFYQKFWAKLKASNTTGKTILFILSLFAFSGNESLKAKEFNSVGYKFFKMVQPPKSIRGSYGILELDQEVLKNSRYSDLRLIWNSKALAYFRRPTIQKIKNEGSNKPKLIFSEVGEDHYIQIYKLKKLPKDNEYSYLEITGESYYQGNLSLSISDELGQWESIGSRSIYKFLDEESSRVHFQADNKQYLRIKYNSLKKFSVTRAYYSIKEKTKTVKIKVEESEISRKHESDTNATLIYYNNSENKSLDRMVLEFKQTKYNRNISVYRLSKTTKEYVEHFLIRIFSSKPEENEQVIDLYPTISVPLKLEIQNKDDEPLDLKKIAFYTLQQELVFKLPITYKPEDKLLLYYGNPYVNLPEYDIKSLYGEGEVAHNLFKLDIEKKNQEYGYSITEPPLSSWIIRILFFIGLTIVGVLLYRGVKKSINMERPYQK